LNAGGIVLVDWRGGALPGEPTKIRPAILVSADDLFNQEEPTIIVVPMTTQHEPTHAVLSLRIEPTPENGAIMTSWAVAHRVSTVSRRRVRETPSRVTDDQLWEIRERIALAIGVV
jgi:mRNA interferase MazF